MKHHWGENQVQLYSNKESSDYHREEITKISGEKISNTNIQSSSNTKSFTAPPFTNSPVDNNIISSSTKNIKYTTTRIAVKNKPSSQFSDSFDEYSTLNTNEKEATTHVIYKCI